MLCLGRKFFNDGGGKESVLMFYTSDGPIKVTLLEAKKNLSGNACGARIGIEAPPSVNILREELVVEQTAVKAG